ncbi:MAG: cell division protein FtsZ [Deltaproteobacteria bacterium]|nr:cell division protein FtsZ [Deltaproteobacteria bacterium]
MKFELIDKEPMSARIKVIGVGGGGSNAVNYMIKSGLQGVDFIVSNTDLKALEASSSSRRIQLGAHLTRGLGAGANPEVGRNAALESKDEIQDAFRETDMLFIAAGMGGGTGTGAAPAVAQLPKGLGVFTRVVVTKPFQFEGPKRSRVAEEGIRAMKEVVDTIITIPNQRLLSLGVKGAKLMEMFKRVDDVLLFAVKGISDIIMIQGLINVDFADVRTVMSEMGLALMGTGVGAGTNRGLEAAQAAISSPLLDDVTISGARGVLINVTGGFDMTLDEVNEAVSLINEQAHEDANIIFGTVLDENLTDELRVTVIATGISKEEEIPVPAAETVRVLRPRRQGLDQTKEKQAVSRRAIEEPGPYYQRGPQMDARRGAPAPGNYVRSPQASSAPDFYYDEDELEVPTFLRRDAD